MIYEKLVELIGECPSGLEPVIYVISCIICVWLLSQFFTVLWSFFMLLFGGRH